jgi:hypothetical protein
MHSLDSPPVRRPWFPVQPVDESDPINRKILNTLFTDTRKHYREV